MYPVEHKYIDFKMMIIRNKVEFISYKDDDQYISSDSSIFDIQERIQNGSIQNMGISQEMLSDLIIE